MKTLQLGSIGPSVQLLQLALVRAGYAPLTTDGIFGSATQYALRRFQQSSALAPDGVVGALTHRALLPWYTGFAVCTVSSGDTLFSVAERYGTTVSAILTANPDTDAQRLAAGSALVVPLPFEVVPTTIDWCSALVGYCVRGLAARYPFIASGEIGKSVMGRPLWCMTLGRGENRVLYSGAHHANEWITAPLLLKFTEQLARAYAEGGTIYSQSAAELLDYATLFIVPAVDPDGIDLVTGELTAGEHYDAALGIASAYPQYPFPSGWKANIRGVDLNLQYPAGWEQARANKAALGVTSPAPANFVGCAPLSAPESRALYDYTLSVSPALILAYHTQGEEIYWRYDGHAAEGAEEIGRVFARLSGYALEDTPFASGFAGYKDWFIDALDRPGYTVEAGRGANPLPIADFDTIYERNLGILTLAALVT